jgi:hypothetical protein
MSFIPFFTKKKKSVDDASYAFAEFGNKRSPKKYDFIFFCLKTHFQPIF